MNSALVTTFRYDGHEPQQASKQKSSTRIVENYQQERERWNCSIIPMLRGIHQQSSSMSRPCCCPLAMLKSTRCNNRPETTDEVVEFGTLGV